MEVAAQLCPDLGPSVGERASVLLLRLASRSGMTPRTASAITAPELAPIPGSLVRVSASTAWATSSCGSGRITSAAARNALTL